MGKKSPSAPAAPDPVATAAAQTATNKETAYWNAVLNNVNQVNPYGTLTYTQTGGGKKYNEAGYKTAMDAFNAAGSTSSRPRYRQDAQGNVFDDSTGQQIGQGLAKGAADQMNQKAQSAPNAPRIAPKYEDFLIGDAPPQFTATTTLSPEQQQLLDLKNQGDIGTAKLGNEQLTRISNAVSTPYSYAGLPEVFGGAGQEEAIKRAEGAINSRLDPQFARDGESLRTRLINQGIGQGSEAYKTEFDTLNKAKNDARQQAILGGQQYGNTAFNESLARRQQAITDYSAQRNAPLNEYSALTSGSQVQNPQFTPISYQGAAPADYAGAVQNNYNAQLGAYNSKVAGQNSLTGSLLGLAGTAAGIYFGAPSAGGAAGLPGRR